MHNVFSWFGHVKNCPRKIWYPILTYRDRNWPNYRFGENGPGLRIWIMDSDYGSEFIIRTIWYMMGWRLTKFYNILCGKNFHATKSKITNMTLTPLKLFEMKKYQNNLNREMKQQYPDRRWIYQVFLNKKT